MPVFDAPIRIQHPNQLLKQLKSRTGLVYLYDNHCPVIAYLPESYWQIQANTAYYYQRQHDFSYQCVKQLPQAEAHQAMMQWLKANPEQYQNFSQFTGGYIGFVSYDDGANFHLKQAIKQRPQPSTYIGCYRSFISKNSQNKYTFYSNETCAEQLYQLLIDDLAKENHIPSLQLTTPCQARWSKSDYQHAFKHVQDYIIAGDCYQINLTQEFNAQADGSLLGIADELWQRTQAPFAGYLQLDDFELLSCSPELFIEWYTPTQIKTRPIKGTLPRHKDSTQDEINRQTLQHSQKDQAENVMIVDLLRNDLSVYAQTGTVKTTKLFEVESFNQVHHLVSEIHAQLHRIHPYQMLMMALPGGSITGAPKIRAMQIIDELEQNARGAYCGSLGYFNFDGTGRWNILIRTIQKYQQDLSVWAGGGITIASNVDAEYQECFDKIGTILNILNQDYLSDI